MTTCVDIIDPVANDKGAENLHGGYARQYMVATWDAAFNHFYEFFISFPLLFMPLDLSALHIDVIGEKYRQMKALDQIR